FHKQFYNWVKTQPADRNFHSPDLTDLEVKPIAGQAGDLLIWHRLLAHGNGYNRSKEPRLAQYITMSPAKEGNQNSRRQRIQAWQERRPTSDWPGDPREWEHKHGTTAELTSLGKKLLGAESW
ncbi:MAG: phytanoyl-CoA dioxygenase family protein, partial [Candidatus Poribacteria bacterium]|nr:phytanoyl-CoA dioxygenase family protein [Candidatus Poribacteria bacterium]